MSAFGAIALAAIAAIPAAPSYADSIRDRQWYLHSLKVAQTRSITTGKGITIAVVDSGVYPHPDLQRNLLKGIDETRRGGDGRVDTEGHGTKISSLIAAHGRRGSGVQGIAPDAKILPVRVSIKPGSANIDDVANGIDWASEHGAQVVNVSLGVGPDFDLAHAVKASLDNDVVIVAAIGNPPKAISASYPAALQGVLAVGATGRSGKYSTASIKSPEVQICAPGVDITGAAPKRGYSVGTGTSDSTAIVSGAAALVRAKFPDLSAKDVIHRLTATADDIGPPGRDDECGFGRLNIVKALTADVPLLAGGTDSASPSAAAPAQPTIAATTPASNNDGAQAGSGSSAAIVFGLLAGLFAVGAVVAVLVVRRRRGD